MTLFAENRNSVDITGTLLVFLVPEDTVFRCPKLKVGTKVGTVMSWKFLFYNYHFYQSFQSPTLSYVPPLWCSA